MSTPQSIVDTVMALPREDRLELAQQLWASLDDEWSWENADPEWRATWEAEIRRRIEDVRSGKVQLVDGEEVFRRIEAKYSS
jgi:putative addiction module component (TIGR02574 family)